MRDAPEGRSRQKRDIRLLRKVTSHAKSMLEGDAFAGGKFSGDGSKKSRRASWVAFKKDLKAASQFQDEELESVWTYGSTIAAIDQAALCACRTAVSRYLYQLLARTLTGTALTMIERHVDDGISALVALNMYFLEGSRHALAELLREYRGFKFDPTCDPQVEFSRLSTSVEMLKLRHEHVVNDDDLVGHMLATLMDVPYYAGFVIDGSLAQAHETDTPHQFIDKLHSWWDAKRLVGQGARASSAPLLSDAAAATSADTSGPVAGAGLSRQEKKKLWMAKKQEKKKLERAAAAAEADTVAAATAAGAPRPSPPPGAPPGSVTDHPKCTRTCAICGPFAQVICLPGTAERARHVGRLHFADHCPTRARKVQELQARPTRAPVAAAARATLPDNSAAAAYADEDSFASLFSLAALCPCDDDTFEDDAYPSAFMLAAVEVLSDSGEHSPKLLAVEEEEMATAINLSLYGTPFEPKNVEVSVEEEHLDAALRLSVTTADAENRKRKSRSARKSRASRRVVDPVQLEHSLGMSLGYDGSLPESSAAAGLRAAHGLCFPTLAQEENASEYASLDGSAPEAMSEYLDCEPFSESLPMSFSSEETSIAIQKWLAQAEVSDDLFACECCAECQPDHNTYKPPWDGTFKKLKRVANNVNIG